MRLSRQQVASIAITILLVAIAVTGCATAFSLAGSSAAHYVELPVPTTAEASPTPTPSPTPSPSPSKRKRPPAAQTKPPTVRTTTKTQTQTATKPAGTEVWNLASGGTGVVGTGSREFLKYRVEVEQSTKLNVASVAGIVDQTLADARGWTAGGWRFQRVTLPRDQVQLVVRVATPATVDKICGQYGLNTGGTVSCRAGKYVMINLTRWNIGVTAYGGDVAGYRHLVLNHEIGHRLGQGHVTCPGDGELQPVMMQIYYNGLQGCTKNYWPYTDTGTRIG